MRCSSQPVWIQEKCTLYQGADARFTRRAAHLKALARCDNPNIILSLQPSVRAGLAERYGWRATCGCSSVVEHLLAKEDVASSSLVTRSSLPSRNASAKCRT